MGINPEGLVIVFVIKCGKLEWWCWSFRPSLELAMQVVDNPLIYDDVTIWDGSGLVLKLNTQR